MLSAMASWARSRVAARVAVRANHAARHALRGVGRRAVGPVGPPSHFARELHTTRMAAGGMLSRVLAEIQVSLGGELPRGRVHDRAVLRDLAHPDTREYIRRENAFTTQLFASGARVSEVGRQLGKYAPTFRGVAEELYNGFWYFTEEDGVHGSVFCRRKDEPGARREVVLDTRDAVRRHGQAVVGMCKIAANDRYLAYTLDTTGDEVYQAYVKDMQTGRTVDVVPNVWSLEISPDGRYLLYTVPDAVRRPDRVRVHRIGGDVADDRDLLVEHEPSVFVDLAQTKNGAHFIISCNSKTMGESWLLSSRDPVAAPVVVKQRREGVQYFVEHAGGLLYLLVKDGENAQYRLRRTPKASPLEHAHAAVPTLPVRTEDECAREASVVDGAEEWEDVPLSCEDAVIEDVDVFRTHAVMYVRDRGNLAVDVVDLAPTPPRTKRVKLPVLGHLQPHPNLWFDSHTVQFESSSLIHPPTTYRYHFDSDSTSVVQSSSGGAFPTNQFTFTTEHATSHDGVEVPLTVFHRADMKRDHSAPMVMLVYGAYGQNVGIYYREKFAYLLDKGWCVAMAHVRGGAELGQHWYDGGRGMNKRNTFHDLVACAEHVTNRGYTQPARLAAMGTSAGGLAVAAALNMRPDLFASAVMQVPFVDVVTAMTDPSLPLTVHEYGEWGNPADAGVLEYMQSYCPYHNIAPQPYPHMLVTTSMNDERVPFWQPLRYCDKVREMKTTDSLVCVHVSDGGGHFGAQSVITDASTIAFLTQTTAGE